jgi:serine/threonine-protein kinase
MTEGPVLSPVVPAAPMPPRPEPRPEPRPAPPPAPRLVQPGETCKDKFFLARQFCLQEECAKPVFANAAACVKMREDAKLREDSKIRN